MLARMGGWADDWLMDLHLNPLPALVQGNTFCGWISIWLRHKP